MRWVGVILGGLLIGILGFLIGRGASAPSPPDSAVESTPGSDAVEPELRTPASINPGPSHDALGLLAGSWAVRVRVRSAPDADPVEGLGSATRRWVLGGRYLQEEFTTNFGERSISGIGYMGYDDAKGQYVNIWMSDWSTSPEVDFGEPSTGAGGPLYQTHDVVEDPGQEPWRTTDSLTVLTEDSHVYRSVWKRGTTSFVNLEIEFTRLR